MASPVDDGELGAWELAKATGYRGTEDRDGSCVSICTAKGSPISTVYSRNKVIRPMTKTLVCIG